MGHSLEPEQILKQIGPFTTEGLIEKIQDSVNRIERSDRDFKGQEVSSGHCSPIKDQRFLKRKLLRTFDKSFPHVSCYSFSCSYLKLHFKLLMELQRSGIQWDLYVNGILEHEGSTRSVN
jgi:hypothetical protein